MKEFNEFLEYFMANHRCLKTSERKVAEHITTYFAGVDPDIISLITRKIKAKGFIFSETTGGGFKSYYGAVAFPFQKARAVAFHEIGHLIDFISLEEIRTPIGRDGWKTKYIEHTYSKEKVLSSGKTLSSIVKNEAEAKSIELCEFLMKRFQKEVLDYVNKDLAGKYILSGKKSVEKDRAKRNYSHNKNKESIEAKLALKKHDEINKFLKENEYFNRIRKMMHKTPEYNRFVDKYNVLLDLLSGCTDEYKYIFPGHSRSYFKSIGFGGEFFAEMFCADAINNVDCHNITSQFLPQSVKAYRELYALINTKEIKKIFAAKIMQQTMLRFK